MQLLTEEGKQSKVFDKSAKTNPYPILPSSAFYNSQPILSRHSHTGTEQEAIDQPFAEESTAQGGSLFIVRAAKVKTVNDVRIAYRALLQNPKNMAAKHNVAAYRLHDPMLSRTENGFCDDGEFGMGRAMRGRINSLGVNDVVVFMTRSYGGNKLGPRRFSVVTALIDKVLQKLERV